MSKYKCPACGKNYSIDDFVLGFGVCKDCQICGYWVDPAGGLHGPDFDEDYFEPSSDAGNMQMLNRMMGNVPSNQGGVPMSGQEKSVRRGTFQPRVVK